MVKSNEDPGYYTCNGTATESELAEMRQLKDVCFRLEIKAEIANENLTRFREQCQHTIWTESTSGQFVGRKCAICDKEITV